MPRTAKKHTHEKRHSNAWDAGLTDEQRDVCFAKATTGGFSWEDVCGWIEEQYHIERPGRTAYYQFLVQWRPHYTARRIEQKLMTRDVIRDELAKVGDMSPELVAQLEDQANALVGRGDFDGGKAVFEMAAKIRDDLRKRIELDLKQQAEARANATLKLAEEKHAVATCEKFLAWFQDAKAREIAESNATNAEKIAALRKTFLSDVEAFEKSGSLVLPTTDNRQPTTDNRS
jgi:hypothetical protein